MDVLPEGAFVQAERYPGKHEYNLSIVRFSTGDIEADRSAFFGKEFAVSDKETIRKFHVICKNKVVVFFVYLVNQLIGVGQLCDWESKRK